MGFEAGQDVVFRTIWSGKISHARPATVVADTDDLIAIYIQPGSMGKTLNRPGDAKNAWNAYLTTGEWTLQDWEWKFSHIVMLHRPGRWSSIWPFWGEEPGEPLAWYVNLEVPWRRTDVGFDSRDLQLDVVIMPDGTWTWKDEAEFQEMIDLGLITEEEAASCRAEGEAVIAEHERGDAWWLEWKDWRSTAAYPIPVLPDGWDVVG